MADPSAKRKNFQVDHEASAVESAAMKRIFIIVGLLLQVGAVYAAFVMPSDDVSDDWSCHEPTSEDVIMECYGADAPSPGVIGIPVTISLFGIGLLVTAIAVGQNAQPRGAAAPPQQPQPPMPPTGQPQAQQHPQAPQQPTAPPSGQPINYQYGQQPQYPPGPPPEN